MDPAEELAYLRLKVGQLERQETRLRAALVAADASIPKRARQAIEGALVALAPLRRLLITLETDPGAEGFEEARELVRAATKLLDEALDG